MGAPVGPNDDAGMETYFYVDLQNNVQGPYPWSHLAQWLDARYITDDLKVTRSGEERWTTLGEMRARKSAGKIDVAAAIAAAEAPSKRNTAGGGGTAGGEDDDEETGDPIARRDAEDAKKFPAEIRAKYVYKESVEDRVKRMMREGKFGEKLIAFVRDIGSGKEGGKGDGGEKGGGMATKGSFLHLGGLGGSASGGSSPATDRGGRGGGGPSSDPSPSRLGKEGGNGGGGGGGGGTKRARDDGGDGDGGAAKLPKKAHATNGQPPVFEPAKPVEIPTRPIDATTRSPGTKGKGKGGKRGAATSGPVDPRDRDAMRAAAVEAAEKKRPGDLIIPRWAIEVIAAAKYEADAKKAEGSDAGDEDGEIRGGGYDSDVSWGERKGTRESKEAYEARVREEREAKAREEEELAAADAAAVAAEKAAAAAAAAPPIPDAVREEMETRARLARFARDETLGEWRAPSAADAWRWSDGPRDDRDLRLELEASGAGFVAAVRAEDDLYRVVRGDGARYGDALDGVKAAGSGKTMRNDGKQRATAARFAGAMFDAIIKNRRRLFYDLVEEPLAKRMDFNGNGGGR